MSGPGPRQALLSCRDVEELAPLYALDALSRAEMDAVSAHLVTCPEAHAELAGSAAAAAALAWSVDPVDAPATLRGRVLDAVASTPQVPDPVATAPRPAPARGAPEAHASPSQGWLERLFGGRQRAWLGAAALGLALLVMVLGIATILERGDQQRAQLALLRQAVEAAGTGQPGVATLSGSGSAAGAAGYAVLPPDEPGFIVVTGLPSVPSEQAYQAWYIADGVPVPAGLLTVDAGGMGTLTGLEPASGTTVVALTVEPRPGVDAPTGDPVVVGELPAALG